MKELQDKLSKLKSSFASLDKEYRESKGYVSLASPMENPKETDHMKEMQDTMYQMIRGVYQYIYSLEDYLYNHISKGHIPPIVGAEKMNKALSALGLDGDYKVEKRTLYASIGKQKTIEIEYKK